MNNIVVFLQNRDFFGAQITHIPLLSYLKKTYPKSCIYIISKYKISSLLLELSYADKLIIDVNKFNTLKEYLQINPNLTINLRKKSSFINLYVSLLNFKAKMGYKTFLTNLFFTNTKKHNSSIYRAQNYLNVVNEELVLENKSLDKRIVIIPGAGGDFKIWDLENYIKVANTLREKYIDYEISFVIGKKEQNFYERLSQEKFQIHFNLDIKKLFSLISKSLFVIANDCGPSHIAQISNSHYLILYTDEDNNANEVTKEWFNNSKNGHCLIGNKHDSINTISSSMVIETADKILKNIV